ncbi:hypothetical protein BO78DRAFT_34200 [Aspergillus sclerotiicarbonarius CBS 121057]|uniref:Secreted protein n=1 Tax=Aspergillus sclerotiicarbonarius (strain CBS 121057 / IBT 28362) TaxID=1448318 RepID=A0A319DTT6_ASPSB|nr:hypothetical protein BO78DRAFT_34200 [Aspergillus sclerotiicarbonarius CBS 121057]
MGCPFPSLGRRKEALPIMALLLSMATMMMTPRDARKVTLFAQLIVTIADRHPVPSTGPSVNLLSGKKFRSKAKFLHHSLRMRKGMDCRRRGTRLAMLPRQSLETRTIFPAPIKRRHKPCSIEHVQAKGICGSAKERRQPTKYSPSCFPSRYLGSVTSSLAFQVPSFHLTASSETPHLLRRYRHCPFCSDSGRWRFAYLVTVARISEFGHRCGAYQSMQSSSLHLMPPSHAFTDEIVPRSDLYTLEIVLYFVDGLLEGNFIENTTK